MKIKDKNLMGRKLTLNVLIILSFIIFSVFSISYIWYSNQLHLIGDSAFHIARLYDLIKSKSLFPEYALDSFSFIGNSVMVMYPYVFLYVTVVIFWTLGSIKHAIFVAFVIWTFVTFLISFYSSLKLSNSKKVSYLFALIYTLSGEFTAMYFSSIDLGVYFSSIFLPLVIFGFVYYLKKDKWLMLSIGMSFELFSSVISFAFISAFLFIWLLFNIKKVNRSYLMNLCKATILTIITTSFIWIPMIKVMILNKLSVPTNPIISPLKIKDLIADPLANNFVGANFNQMLTIYSFIGIILGILFFKKLTKILKNMFLFGVLVILCTTYIFPWKILQNFVSLRSIQFTARFLVIPQVIFEFIFSFCIVKHLKSCKKATRILSFIALIVFILLIQLTGQDLYVSSNQGTIDNFYQDKQGIINVGYKDYWPNASISKYNDLFNHVGISNNNKIQFTPKGNGNYQFDANGVNNGYIKLPFLYYHGTRYKCYLNHKRVRIHSDKNQLMTINHVKNGKYYMHISILNDYWALFGRAISILSIFAYLMIIFVRFKNRFVKRFGLKRKIEASK